MKLKYIVVYKKSSDQYDIEYCWIKVKVTVLKALKCFPDLQQYKLSGLITQLWFKLGSVCSFDTNIQKIYEYSQA